MSGRARPTAPPAMKRLAVLTSGGDAPGMNAAIRAVVRAGLSHGWEIFGIQQGFAGLVAGDVLPLRARDVGGILVEVMGRDCGFLTLMAGLAGGAEAIVIPEVETLPEVQAGVLRDAAERGKLHALIVVAEGARHNATALARYFRGHHCSLGFDLRVAVLGHVQRGGRPSAFDRLLATRLGAAAVDCVAQRESGVLIGLRDGVIQPTPLAMVATNQKPLDLRLLELMRVLAR